MSKLCVQVSSLTYCFYCIYYSIVWGHYQYYQQILKLLTHIALCEHVYDNGTKIVKSKF